MMDKLEWSDKIYGKGKYINSGVYIAETKFLLEVLEEVVRYYTPDAVSKVENLQLGEGLPGTDGFCKRLPNFPLGADCQIIFRYLHDKYYPDMQIDNKYRLTKQGR